MRHLIREELYGPHRGAVAFCCLLLGSACAGSAPNVVPGPEIATVLFHGIATARNGALHDEVVGTARVYESEIRLVLTRGKLVLAPAADNRPSDVSAALAYGDTAAVWNVRREGIKVPVSGVRLRDDTLVDSLVLVIPNTKGLDLRLHWLVVRVHGTLFFKPRQQWVEATRYIYGDSKLFDRNAFAGSVSSDSLSELRGVVLDRGTQSPARHVVVTARSEPDHVSIDSRSTDSTGRFEIAVRAGAYRMDFAMPDGTFPTVDSVLADRSLVRTYTVPLQEAERNRAYQYHEVDQHATPEREIKPQFPPALVGGAAEGEVLLSVVVDTTGLPVPETMHVIKSPNPAFDLAVYVAIRGWRFRPARKGGQAVREIVILPFVFSQ